MSCPPTERAAQDKTGPASVRPSPRLGPVRGAYEPHGVPARMHDLRHTGRHQARHAPYPVPRVRASHTPSMDEEDIGSSDSSSTTSDYSSGDSEGSKDELEEDEEESEERSQGFGFSAATWTSSVAERGRSGERARGRASHYVMEEGPGSRYYPGRQHGAHAYRRPVSPEPLYREYREYRDSRHHRTSRSSQTSPVRIEPISPVTPRTFVRALTPSRFRQCPPAQTRPKYQYQSRVPPPPPSLSAPLTLRPPPPTRPRPLSSNAHAVPPPRIVLPAPKTDLDHIDDEDDYKLRIPGPPPDTPAPPPALPVKRTPLLTNSGGSSTSTFALSGGPSAPANNNGTTSTTTTFHVTTPRAISASLAAAQNAAAQPPTAALQAEADKAEAEKMRIPSFKRGGKTRYQCLYCSKDFSRKNDAYRHMSRKHNDNATEFICVCGRVLSRGDALTRHMRTCRESKEKGTQALAIPGTAFAPVSTVPQPRKKAPKKRRAIPPPPGAIDMDLDGEEELVDNDDVSMEEED